MTPRLMMTIQTTYGTLSYDAGLKPVIVGDRAVPPLIELHFPGVDGQPSFDGRIEVIEGVPRWTDLRISRVPDGREIRQRDLREVGLDEWIEIFVALSSGQVTQRDGSRMTVVQGSGDKDVSNGIRAVRKSREGSRRPLTDDRLKQVAEIYNSQEMGGAEAVGRAFGKSKSTALRWIDRATDAGYITDRPRQSKRTPKPEGK